MYRVYGDLQSGNCYKIKLLLNHLEFEHEWEHVDVRKGQSRTEEFLRFNPNGKIPVLEFEPGQYLWESNAILNYLAEGTPYLPGERLARARVLQWQCFEQYSHEPYIAVRRYIAKYLGLPEERRAEYEAKQAGGYAALGVMEQQLRSCAYLVNETLSIADFSLFAYTHVASEGGFSLADYPGVRRWIAAIEAHPKHIPMPPSGAAARL